MITYEDVKLAAEKVIADKGSDYVYKDSFGNQAPKSECVYLDQTTKQPSCVVGHIGHVLGFDDSLALMEGNNVDLLGSYIDIDPEAVDFLDSMQGAQDSGVPWGEALRRAIACIEFYKKK